VRRFFIALVICCTVTGCGSGDGEYDLSNDYCWTEVPSSEVNACRQAEDRGETYEPQSRPECADGSVKQLGRPCPGG
jgi:hypothetical protein